VGRALRYKSALEDDLAWRDNLKLGGTIAAALLAEEYPLGAPITAAIFIYFLDRIPNRFAQ
jgi:hypothetical protein